MKEAGLDVVQRSPTPLRYSDDELFKSIREIEQKIGHVPSFSEYRANEGFISIRPFKKRFGNWEEAVGHYNRWKLEDAVIGGQPVAEVVGGLPKRDIDKELPITRGQKLTIRSNDSNPNPSQFYGEPIDFRGLRHAPINEQGVVYLFGMVSRELGFSVESVQQGFPDCEAKYLHDRKRNLWAKARIEFEFKASNFREHGHDADQCDFIVCWENNWPDCPLTVIELKKAILTLRAD